MPKALLYARFSSDMQSETSAEDQLRLCRARARALGLDVAAEFTDLAISGAVRNRPGFNALIAAAEAGEGDTIIAESLDRLSRDMEDLAGFHKRMDYLGAKIITLSEGEISAIHVGIGGMMAQIQLKQIGEKVKRGQMGRLAAGRIPGGLSYGYRMVREFDDLGGFERGLRAIDDHQAETVRLIFRLYAEGVGPSAIAKRLNMAGVPSPRGGQWNASTIIGNAKRRNGILNNELYIGRILFNRQSFRKDPDSRKRQARINDASDWQAQDVPDLAIVDRETWERVRARLDANGGQMPHRLRRPKKLLSGLMFCGSCSGTVTIIGGDRWGCSTHFQKGTCDNGRTISNAKAEARLWRAMQHEWLHPDAIAAYIDEYVKTAAEGRRARAADRAKVEARLAQIDVELDRIADAIVAGVAIERMKRRADAIEAERAQLIAGLDEETAGAAVIDFPNLADQYRARVESLTTLLAGGGDGSREAATLIRSMIAGIHCHPNPEGAGLVLDMTGQLATILAISKGADPKADPFTVKLVAGAGFAHCSNIVRARI